MDLKKETGSRRGLEKETGWRRDLMMEIRMH